MASLERLRRLFSRKEKFIPINELLSYRTEQGSVYIQVMPEKEIDNVLVEFTDGLRELAKIVSQNESIKKITANSWIVAEHPAVMERFGFTVTGEIKEDLKQKHFRGEKRPVWGAYMSREEFINMYLN